VELNIPHRKIGTTVFETQAMKRIDLAKVLFFLTALVFSFSYGVAVGTYQIFPHAILDNAKDSVYSDVTTLIGEVPNLTGTEPIHFLGEARYDGAGVTVNKVPDGSLFPARPASRYEALRSASRGNGHRLGASGDHPGSEGEGREASGSNPDLPDGTDNC
jgi:hypothetical protein